MRGLFRLLRAYRHFVLAFVVGMAGWIGRNLSRGAFAGHTNNYRIGWITGAALVVAIGITMPSHATTGTIRVTVAKAGFILGAGGGKGVLTFHHRNYPFAVQGLSLGLTAGASINNFVGRAEHIKELSDFAGNCYVAWVIVYAFLSRSIALRMVRSFLATAIRASLAGFPAWRSFA